MSTMESVSALGNFSIKVNVAIFFFFSLCVDHMQEEIALLPTAAVEINIQVQCFAAWQRSTARPPL